MFHLDPGPTGILIEKKEKIMTKTGINKVYKDMAQVESKFQPSRRQKSANRMRKLRGDKWKCRHLTCIDTQYTGYQAGVKINPFEPLESISLLWREGRDPFEYEFLFILVWKKWGSEYQ